MKKIIKLLKLLITITSLFCFLQQKNSEKIDNDEIKIYKAIKNSEYIEILHMKIW